MDTAFVYNISDITIPDSMSVVVTNMPDQISLSEGSLSVCDSIQNQLFLSNTKIDSLLEILQLRGAEGWGMEQVLWSK